MKMYDTNSIFVCMCGYPLRVYFNECQQLEMKIICEIIKTVFTNLKMMLIMVVTDKNLIKEIGTQAHAEINPVWSNYVGTKAIDLNDATDADTCGCCAGTETGPSWWRLNLGNQYAVDTIIFVGRSDKCKYAN